ncbi:MAG: SusC/RagA family TonB-linked outer membrane protein, partial [Mangrovibacterium sp.]|nr:SusC/RagA family TonB-linked outer membrane protein [Mangrovibacterium sp.]
NLYATYKYEKLKNQTINLMAGYSHEENDFTSFSAYRRLGLISAQLPTMSAGSTGEQNTSEGKSDYALNSVFSRLEYSYKNRYLLDGVFRYDGSSRFAEGHKWAPFFGFSGGWIVSEESFMGNVKNVIDFLKVRASWGELGNQSGIALYDYLSQINIGGSYPMGSYTSPVQAQSATLGSMPSTTRTWETIESKNLGVDFRAFGARLTGTVDVFIKDNKDMFFVQEFPTVLGTTAPSINGAHLRTKGWELEIGWRDKIKQLDYSVKFNLQDNHNKVIELADAVIPKQGTNTFVQGYPASSYFGYRYDGFIQSDSELTEYKTGFTSGIPNNIKLGDARYKDLDNDGKLEALPYALDENGVPTSTSGDLVQIGDGGQHYLYGISLGLSWKNFDFSTFFQGVLNWQVISAVMAPSNDFDPIESYFHHETWAPERTDVIFPRLSQNGAIKKYNYQVSDAPYKLYNNRYIRLKNIQLGYTLPKNITNRLKMDKLRVYFSGTDIWEHSNLPGNQDPETPFERRLSPFPRQYSFGLTLTL